MLKPYQYGLHVFVSLNYFISVFLNPVCTLDYPKSFWNIDMQASPKTSQIRISTKWGPTSDFVKLT